MYFSYPFLDLFFRLLRILFSCWKSSLHSMRCGFNQCVNVSFVHSMLGWYLHVCSSLLVLRVLRCWYFRKLCWLDWLHSVRGRNFYEPCHRCDVLH